MENQRLRRALEQIVALEDCQCGHDDENCCVRVNEPCAVCIAAVTLMETPPEPPDTFKGETAAEALAWDRGWRACRAQQQEAPTPLSIDRTDTPADKPSVSVRVPEGARVWIQWMAADGVTVVGAHLVLPAKDMVTVLELKEPGAGEPLKPGDEHRG